MTTVSAQRTLITGASSGIGEAFARAYAARGAALILTARSTEKLERLAVELRNRHGIAVDVVSTDLAASDGPATLLAALAARNLTVDTLINNAGFGTQGRFAELDPEREIEEIRLNVGSPVALARGLLPGMLARRSGAIVNVASTAAFQPCPYMATYGATKAFLLSWSEALAEETRGTGVHVLALCPGKTDTAFFDRIGEMRYARARTPQDVVATALRALDRKAVIAIDGRANALLTFGTRLTPRAVNRRIAAAMLRPSSARE